MAAIPLPDEIWADFNLDGTVKEPAKQDIRRWSRFVQALAESNGMETYVNKATMDADTTQDDGQAALIYADPVETNNFPTVWIWDDGGNVWLQGTDRIASLQALIDPLVAQITAAADGTIQFANGLSAGGVDLKAISNIYWEWAIVSTGWGVIFGRRGSDPINGDAAGKYFLVGEEVGVLSDAQIAQVESLIGASGSISDAELTPTGLNAGALIEYGAEGTRTVYDPAPYDFTQVWPRQNAKRDMALTTRPYMISSTPVAVSGALALAVPSSPEFLFIIPVNGQSLAVGFRGNPLSGGMLVNPYPDRILKVSGLDVRLGRPSDAGTIPALDPNTITDFGPLVSMTGTGGADYGVTVCEGIGAGILAQLDTVMAVKPRILFYVIGEGGTPYSGLAKGTQPYTDDMAAMTKICAIAQAKGWTPVALCTVLKHGEADGASLTYAADLAQWQADKEADYQAITGQVGKHPLLVSQPSAFSSGNQMSGLAMLQQVETFPDRFGLVGPDYPMRNLYDPDLTHFVGQGYYDFGYNYFAPGILRQCFGHGALALRPNRADVTWNGTTLTIGFHIPVPPMVIDTVTMPDPGDYGFTASDGSGDLPVDTVTLVSGGTKLAFTFTRALVGTGTLKAAQVGYVGTKLIANQPRTCIRDSRTGTYKNWLCHFIQTFS
jgi:hypothetical protein